MKSLSSLLKSFTVTAAIAGIVALGSQAAFSAHHKSMGHGSIKVGGEAMLPTKNIVQNAVNSKDHTTLVAAVKAAGLVDTLQSKGPFTVFAPTNSAFGKLPKNTVPTLLKKENLGTLKGVLTYHVVAGRLDKATLWKWVKKGNGKTELKTVAGGKLWVIANGPANLIIKDEKGNSANVPTYDVMQSNGVIHVIDTVLMPK